MGSSPKTLQRLKQLTWDGFLQPGSSICDIGATQLFGDAGGHNARDFLTFYAERYDQAIPPDRADPDKLAAIINNGFLGDLLILAGFKYTALDIFHGTNTILFDLNVHAPGPDLHGKFDLILNLGTTEHVFNQLRAFQTIHDLTRLDGVIYNDLPMGGYLNHALYRYDPLFFSSVLPVNCYEKILERISVGGETKVPNDLTKIGYTPTTYTDVGLELICRKSTLDPFRIPLEASTALSIDPAFGNITQSNFVIMPTNISVHYGTSTSFEHISFQNLTAAWWSRVKRGIANRLRG
ncbi:SAM-dependent methyltransferase [Tardiphaga robiniae]|uniref:hypothetical protein n=1 Tax=Tardiphaga robiniae TaxID=943830 RepID=UPI002858A663|nr:hypothetical protein [Tardiphaga robiniae]MDR6661141.1 SAM-dependent methyltransferase [Tardiphaga robiniae]